MSNPRRRQGGRNVKTNNAPVGAKPQDSPLKRIADLEGKIEMIMAVLGQQVERFNGMLPRIEALVQLAGVVAVDTTMDQIKVKRATDSLALALAENRVKVAETIQDGCLVVGRELNKADETVMPPGRVQVQFDQFVPELKEALRGKGPGATWENDTVRFVVDEVYANVEPPVVVPTVTVPEAQTEAAE